MTTPASTVTTSASLLELDKERRMGGLGTETTAREIRRIDLSDVSHSPARRAEIAEQLWSAATEIGFFQVSGHGIDLEQVDQAFAMAARFFALPREVKAQYPLRKELNSGWEFKSQVRPSIGVPDQKESFQVTRPHMAGLWPTDAEVEGFQEAILAFERRCWEVAMRILSCFADRLGLPGDFFTTQHDPGRATYLSTLRMLHYPAVPEEARGGDVPPWRAGAHTDFDCLTLLFQRAGQGGLQVLPGAEAETEQWTPVEPSSDTITCNIGDMLMRWSDGRLPSNFHRVRGPRPDEDQGARYSIAFFAQANTDALMESPTASWEPITAGDFLAERIRANYGG